MTSSVGMKPQEGRDWPFAIFMVVLMLLTLVLAMFDRSCHRQSDRLTSRFGPLGEWRLNP